MQTTPPVPPVIRANDQDADPAKVPEALLRQWFEQALLQAPDDRDNWLGKQLDDVDMIAAVRRLLKADQDAGALDLSPLERACRIGDAQTADEGWIGQRIGPFRLTAVLGQGGMAAVFLGEREEGDFRQRVAIKILRRGLYSDVERRLFRRERQALAALSHPNIAHFIDGGMTESGLPFLAMEFVDGRTLTDYVRLAALNLRERLALVAVICRAVGAAHANLIVHRDIKPSNILVTSAGEVKLLDFGIAKLLDDGDDSATRTGMVALTPGYAAPEQFDGGVISTATDVYALGVLLHELLLGVRPDSADPGNRRPSDRIVPTRNSPDAALGPAALRTRLRGDIDNIVMKCLATEPARRYRSADELADDIDRHLSARPVTAHPPSRWYRTAKFVQRHRGGVLVSALFLVGLMASLGVALWQAGVARQEAVRANTVRDFVVGVFGAARAELPRDLRPTPEFLLKQASERIDQDAFLDDATRADVLQTIGEVWLSLSDFDAADRAFAKAQTLSPTSLGELDNAELYVLRSDTWHRAGRDGDAIRSIDAALPILRQHASPMLLRALSVKAAATGTIGQPDQALALQQEAVALAVGQFGSDSVEALAAGLAQGRMLVGLQRYPQAQALIRPLLARWRERHAPEDDRYLGALESLVVASDAIGDSADSETSLREMLALKLRIYPSPHDSIATTTRSLAQVLGRGANPAESETLFADALEMQVAIFGKDHSAVAATLDAWGVILASQRRFDEADSRYREVLGICLRGKLTDEVCPRARNNLGQALYRRSRYAEAEQQMRIALDERRQLFGADHPSIAYSLSTLANVAAVQGKHADAVTLSGEALGILDRTGHAGSREASLIRYGYAQALALAGRDDEALMEIDRALADWRRLSPDGHAREVGMLVQKAQSLRSLGRTDALRASVDEAIALRVPATELAETTRNLLRDLSGRADVYPPQAPTAAPPSPAGR